MYQMIYRISINLYRYEYRMEKTDRYPALPVMFGFLGWVENKMIVGLLGVWPQIL